MMFVASFVSKEANENAAGMFHQGTCTILTQSIQRHSQGFRTILMQSIQRHSQRLTPGLMSAIGTKQTFSMH
jgi:hypothetical protein